MAAKPNPIRSPQPQNHQRSQTLRPQGQVPHRPSQHRTLSPTVRLRKRHPKTSLTTHTKHHAHTNTRAIPSRDTETRHRWSSRNDTHAANHRLGRHGQYTVSRQTPEIPRPNPHDRNTSRQGITAPINHQQPNPRASSRTRLAQRLRQECAHWRPVNHQPACGHGATPSPVAALNTNECAAVLVPRPAAQDLAAYRSFLTTAAHNAPTHAAQVLWGGGGAHDSER